MPRKPVPIEKIRIDGGTQPRVAVNQEVVADYAESIKAGDALPPVVIYFDGTATGYWLADGFHRYYAALAAGQATIDADVRNGIQRDAVLYSVGANAAHGLRRSNADKRRAVETLLKDAEWAKWSDREIAKRCGVTHFLVASVRTDVSGASGRNSQMRTVKRGEQTYQQDVSKIGKPAAAAPPEPEEGKDSGDEEWPDAEPAPAQQRPTAAPQTVARASLDSVGNIIPAHLAGVFADDTLAKVQGFIQQARAVISDGVKSGRPSLAQAERQRMDIDLKNVWEAAKFARPYAVCMHHKGKACVPCKGTGWLVKTSYDRLVSEQKAGRK